MADDEDDTRPPEETPEHAVPTEEATEIAGSAEDAALEAMQEAKEHPQAGDRVRAPSSRSPERRPDRGGD